MGQNILDLAWETLDFVILANSLPNKEKPNPILQASIAFDKLKIRLRLAHEIKLINHRIQAFLAEKNEEIGKMLAGWLKWAEKTFNVKLAVKSILGFVFGNLVNKFP